MADLNAMADNIKDNLSRIPGIMSAYDHEPQNISNLPAATLYFDNFTQSDATTKRSSVNWQWTIRLYIRLNTSDVKDPQVKIRSLIMDTIRQLREDISLGATCLYHTVSSGEVFALLEQTNPMMVAELTLTATTQDL